MTNDVKFFSGSAIETVIAAQEEIDSRGSKWQAKPIEFTAINGSSELLITISFKKMSTAQTKPKIRATLKELIELEGATWAGKLSLGHPVLQIAGQIWLFGIG